MSTAVERILQNYAGETPGVIGNLRRLMMTGRLSGTGKMVILPVDQGFEHGPARSFQPNPAGYDPRYHAQLAVESGCSGYAAPLGFIEAIAHEYAGVMPLILKVNNSDVLGGSNDAPISAVTSAVDDALRLAARRSGTRSTPAAPSGTGCTKIFATSSVRVARSVCRRSCGPTPAATCRRSTSSRST